MIPHGVEIFVGLDPVDLRWGFERLAGLVTEKIGRDAWSGALFLFVGKRRHAVKVLFFDGSGMCLFYQRLDRGAFRIPAAPGRGRHRAGDHERALDDLLDGIDLDTAPPAPRRRTTTH